MSVTFFVAGVPVPQGSKKGFVVGRRAVIVDDNKTLLHPWREQIARVAFSTWAYLNPVEGAVRVRAEFVLPRPASVKRALPHVRPDSDKLARALLDGITQAGNVWHDDSQVVSLVVDKVYGAAPGVHVTVEAVIA